MVNINRFLYILISFSYLTAFRIFIHILRNISLPDGYKFFINFEQIFLISLERPVCLRIDFKCLQKKELLI